MCSTSGNSIGSLTFFLLPLNGSYTKRSSCMQSTGGSDLSAICRVASRLPWQLLQSYWLPPLRSSTATYSSSASSSDGRTLTSSS